MTRLWGLRWWMMGLLMAGSVINYLTRSTLGVAAPTVLKDLDITTQQYSWVLSGFQVAIMLQPICGYVMDTVGLKAGFAIFATSWSFFSMAHGLAGAGRRSSGFARCSASRKARRIPPASRRPRSGFPPPSAGWPAASSTWARRSGRCSRRRSWRGRF
jgi:ACS family hexuronate transporter-like MFS transporter